MANRKARAEAVAAARASAMTAASQIARDGMRLRGWSAVDLSEASDVPWPVVIAFLHGQPQATPIGRANAIMSVFGMRLLPPLNARHRRG